MPIEGLSTSRRLPRLGKIHLGTRHPDKGYPMKTDYFVCPPEVQAIFGEKPKELRILIPVEDEEKWASQFYRCYSKTRGLICKGDGITAMRMIDTQTGAMADRDSKAITMKEIPCKGRECPDYKIKCKEVMNLQFLLPEVKGLGVWQIDTSSRNSIININSMADLIKAIYKKITMIPLLLTLEPKEVNNPDDGKKQTVYVLNLRVNMKLADLALMARKQTEILELPIGDDERPDLISPEFERDEVDMPEGLEPITPENVETIAAGLWGELSSEESKLAIKKIKVGEPELATTPAESLPKSAPSDLKELKDMMKLCNWSAKDFGQFCVSKNWKIKVYEDLKPEQITEAIDYISKNPT